MNNLLIFFALPIATIILAGIFQTIIKCPYKIAGITFAIYLIVAFALGGTAELIIVAIIYTILAFLTALLVMFFENNSNTNSCSNTANNSCSNTSINSCINTRTNSSCGCSCRNR